MSRKLSIKIVMCTLLAMCIINILNMGEIEAAEGDVAIDSTNFPDEVFKNYVSEKFDVNKDGILSQAEAEGATSIYLSRTDVADLKGIEHFLWLNELYCTNTKLTSLDVSKNTALTVLSCGENSLTSLDVGKNIALTELHCYKNDLTSLDVSKNTALIELDCSSNKLTSLDLSNNISLRKLYCNCNRFTSLDVSKNINLIVINCEGNYLTTVDVSKNTQLKVLACEMCHLTSLDVSKNIELNRLSCANNSLTSIDLSHNINLDADSSHVAHQFIFLPCNVVDGEVYIDIPGARLDTSKLTLNDGSSYDSTNNRIVLETEPKVGTVYIYYYESGSHLGALEVNISISKINRTTSPSKEMTEEVTSQEKTSKTEETTKKEVHTSKASYITEDTSKASYITEDTTKAQTTFNEEKSTAKYSDEETTTIEENSMVETTSIKCKSLENREVKEESFNTAEETSDEITLSKNIISSETKDDGGNGWISGIVIGIAIISVFAAILFMIWKKRAQKQEV